MPTGREDPLRPRGYDSGEATMKLGAVTWLTDLGVGIADLATTVEQAKLESLFLTEHHPCAGHQT